MQGGFLIAREKRSPFIRHAAVHRLSRNVELNNNEREC